MFEKKNRHWRDQLGAVAMELSKLAIACDIDINAPGVSEKILKNDDSVCRRKNPEAFRKIRTHLAVLFPLQNAAIDRIGATETRDMRDEVWGEVLALRSVGTGRAADPKGEDD